jgi:chromatin segregation and condensation protein Rec8/ScpA/Scc1 (kleisin family)
MDRVLYRRGRAEVPADPGPEELLPHDVRALLAAWGKLEQRLQRSTALRGVAQRSLRAHQAQLLQVLMNVRRMDFSRLLAEHFDETPALVVVTFLALLNWCAQAPSV